MIISILCVVALGYFFIIHCQRSRYFNILWRRWAWHMSQRKSVATTCSYCIWKCFSTNNICSLRKAYRYKTLCLPKTWIQYPIWSPYLQKDIGSNIAQLV